MCTVSKVHLSMGTRKCHYWLAGSTHCLVCHSAVYQCTVCQCTVCKCTSVQCTSVQCASVQCTSVQCASVQCISVQCTSVQCASVQCASVQCTSVQCATGCLEGLCCIRVVKRVRRRACDSETNRPHAQCRDGPTWGARARTNAAPVWLLSLALSRAVRPAWRERAGGGAGEPIKLVNGKLVNEEQRRESFTIDFRREGKNKSVFECMHWMRWETHVVLDISVGSGLQQQLDGPLVVERCGRVQSRVPLLGSSQPGSAEWWPLVKDCWGSVC